MTTLPKAPTTDLTSTTLNGSINSSQTSAVVNDASTIQTPTYAWVDRQDINGNNLPNSREMIYISSKASNTLTITRGVNNSTARSHNDSAIVEPILSVGQWADMYSWATAEHLASDGTHDITKIAVLSGATIQTLAGKILSSATLTAPTLMGAFISGATINSLNVNTYLNASGASLSGIFPSGASGTILQSLGASAWPTFITAPALKVKVATTTRDISLTTNQAITGIGFTPKAVYLMMTIGGGSTSASSWGFTDGTTSASKHQDETGKMRVSAELGVIWITSTTINAFCTLSSFDADGFTLAWSKNGSPTGTATMDFICIG